MMNKIKTFKDLKKKILIANTSVDKLDMRDITLTYNCHEDGLIRINPYKKSNVLLSIHLNRDDGVVLLSTKHRGKYYQTELDWTDKFSLCYVILDPNYLASDVIEHKMDTLAETLKPKHEDLDEYINRVGGSFVDNFSFITTVVGGGMKSASRRRYKYLASKYIRLIRLLLLIRPLSKNFMFFNSAEVKKMVNTEPNGWLESIFGFENIEDEFDLMGDAAREYCDIFSRWDYNQFQKLIEWYPNLAKRNNEILRKHPLTSPRPALQYLMRRNNHV